MATPSEMNKVTSTEDFMSLVDEEFAAAKKCSRGFRPRPTFDAKDDCLSFYAAPGIAIRKRINSLLTVYVSAKDRSLIGCEIKSVRKMLELKGSFGVIVGDGRLTLGVFLMLALTPSIAEPEPIDNDGLQQYEDELKEYKDVEIEEGMLCPA